MDPYIIAIDFDDTICEGGWPNIDEGSLITDMVIKMHKQIERNPSTVFILWTCRTDSYFHDAVNFCKRYDLPISYYNEEHPVSTDFNRGWGGPLPVGKLKKLFAHEYWDDKNRLLEHILREE